MELKGQNFAAAAGRNFWFWPQESRAAAGAAFPRSIYADKNAEDKKKKKVESCF